MWNQRDQVWRSERTAIDEVSRENKKENEISLGGEKLRKRDFKAYVRISIRVHTAVALQWQSKSTTTLIH